MNFLIIYTYLIMNINKGVDYMCNNETNTCENCIADILKVILLLQQSVCQNDTCLQTCDRGYLGQNCTTFCNTRPITLYTCSSSFSSLNTVLVVVTAGSLLIGIANGVAPVEHVYRVTGLVLQNVVQF